MIKGMKRLVRNILLLTAPFIIMVLINEYMRATKQGKGHQAGTITAINAKIKSTEKCSWICHDNTAYCKRHHVKMPKACFHYTDPVYFGIIKALKSTGDYGLANVLILVVILPLAMYFLLIKSLDIQLEINILKK